jgi:hypothetical protein
VYNSPIQYTDPSGHCIFGLDTLVCAVAGAALVVAAIFFTNEMPVGEGAPPFTVMDQAKNYVKSGTDFVGDAYTLLDEYPENVGLNAVGLAVPFAPSAVVKGGAKAFRLRHGTRAARSAFKGGINASIGGGQLGPGFYVTHRRDTAEWFARYWSRGTGSPKVLNLTIPEDELRNLKIIQLAEDSPEYLALTEAWRYQRPIPSQYQYLIEDYDAILAPVFTSIGESWQLKFNPRAQDFLNKYSFEFEDLP